jgi:hypothetical protein
MARQTGKRETRRTYVVLGDGQTEQYYLKHLKTLKGYKYTIRPSLFSSITIETAGSIIDEYISGGCDQIIYFTDYDTIVNQNKIAEFEKLKGKYVETKEVFICETMPSIEFWFLLHFLKTTREFNNASQAISLLVKYMQGYTKGEDYLKKSKWVETLCSDGKTETACSNSSSILTEKEKGDKGSHFPYSKAHIAIEQFEKQKKITKE